MVKVEAWKAKSRANHGQANIEFVGTVPVVLLVLALVWQLVLAGQTAWMTSNAARVAARAQAVGRNPEQAARSALPGYLEKKLVVKGSKKDGDGSVSVKVTMPLLLHAWSAPFQISSVAGLQRQQ